MPYTTLIFDLDGTLSDPALGVVRCINFALTSFDQPPRADHEITRHIGPPLEQIFALLSDEDDPAHVSALAARYRERYLELGFRENTLYPEAKATLEIYLNNSVGIGEHPQHIEEIDKLLQKIVDAQEKLKEIQHFKL